MIPVFQTKQHDPPRQNGNCFRACIASILEIDIDDMPFFEDIEGDKWWSSLQDWCKSRGLVALWSGVNGKTETRITLEELKLATGLPKGWSIITGKSQTFADIDHCIVALDGFPHFDPQPLAVQGNPPILDVVDFIMFELLEVA